MYNQPYFIPGYSSMVAPSMMRGAIGGAMRGAMGNAMRGASTMAGASRGLGLFGRLGNSFSAIRGINWGGLINNASKTLGVINQTIPLVRQAGPMISNMKSMLRVASLFKDESEKSHNISSSLKNGVSQNYRTSNRTKPSNIIQANSQYKNNNQTKENDSLELSANYNNFDGSPTFFIGS